jgi:hypothetical protein
MTQLTRFVESIIQVGTDIIKNDNVDELDDLYTYLIEKTSDDNIKFDLLYVYSKLFLNACLYNKKNSLEFMYGIYSNLSDLEKMRLKDTIIHGKYSIARLKNDDLIKWYSETFLIYKSG